MSDRQFGFVHKVTMARDFRPTYYKIVQTEKCIEIVELIYPLKKHSVAY